MPNGLIIMGYQGIGKSTLARKYIDVIDFESSLLKINNNRFDNWEQVYCNMAIDLASQGNIVLTSSHKNVREEFAKYVSSKIHIISICPSINLKNSWINTLLTRYNQNKSDKNLAAYKNAVNNFDNSVTDISKDFNFSNIIIDDLDYDLFTIIKGLCNIYNIRTPLEYHLFDTNK